MHSFKTRSQEKKKKKKLIAPPLFPLLPSKAILTMCKSFKSESVIRSYTNPNNKLMNLSKCLLSSGSHAESCFLFPTSRRQCHVGVIFFGEGFTAGLNSCFIAEIWTFGWSEEVRSLPAAAQWWMFSQKNTFWNSAVIQPHECVVNFFLMQAWQ